MTLKSLIDVLDADTMFTVQKNHEDVFNGLPDEFTASVYDDHEVKAVWYSRLYTSLMIEI